MSKKLIFVLVIVFFLSRFNLARAAVIIDEIMYAPASGDSEWIEIFNSGNDSVDLNDWRFFNNKDDSAPLRIQKGSAVLSPGGYAIITATSDSSSFSGTVFSSSQFSLPNDSSKYNTYKAISDSNKQNINSVTYITSPDTLGTGNSLQLINGEWKSAIRTPGAQSQSPSPSPSGTGSLIYNNSDSSNSSNINTEPKTKVFEIPKIKTQITGKTLDFVGLPLSFQAMAYGYQGEQLHFGKYFWNFGDGDSKEIQVINSQQFTHTYFYPGDYIVSLFYYQNYYSDTPDASDQMTIKIIPADFSISRVGDEKDFFVEIANNTDYNADLSNWFLASGRKNFTIPRNTILASKKKMIISPKITNFSIEDKNTLKLMTPDREVVFDYFSSKNKSQNKNLTQTKIPAENLPALALSNDVLGQDSKNLYSSPIVPLASLVFIGTGAGAVYFIRRKKVIPQIGNDFEILDE